MEWDPHFVIRCHVRGGVRRIKHQLLFCPTPDSKVHEANMGSIWGRQDPDGPHVDPMNFAIWVRVLFAMATTTQNIDW